MIVFITISGPSCVLSEFSAVCMPSCFNTYFFCFQAEPIEFMYGLKMATTSQGDEPIMTHEDDVYTFNCTSETNCKWSKEPYSLKISRILHEMLPVRTSFLENC